MPPTAREPVPMRGPVRYVRFPRVPRRKMIAPIIPIFTESSKFVPWSLAFDLETDEQEEDGHERVVDPLMNGEDSTRPAPSMVMVVAST